MRIMENVRMHAMGMLEGYDVSEDYHGKWDGPVRFVYLKTLQ